MSASAPSWPPLLALVASLAAATESLSLLLTGRVWPFVVAGLAAPGLARLGLYLGVHRVGASRASAPSGTGVAGT
jgi:hypothetical protein